VRRGWRAPAAMTWNCAHPSNLCSKSDQSGAKTLLLQAIGVAAESLLEAHQDRLIGTRIGPYRVVSILGHGGMSTVYRGERDDSQYQQTVAIKVLQHATLHPRLRSRLHSERHILATLDIRRSRA
jgi:serine/threonine protein kinase